MSQPRSFGLNGGRLFSNLVGPTRVDLNFVVDASNGNGLGVRSIKSNGYVENVFMHTSSTPGVGGNGLTNPNPAAGFILIQMKQNFSHFIGFDGGFVAPVATSTKIDNGATLTIGQAYIITTVGTATAAQWTTVGVPAGVTPAVGVSFIAIATGAGSGNTASSRVMLPTTSLIEFMEVVGDTNLNTTANVSSQSGQFILLQCMGATNSSTTTPIPVAPAAGSVCGLCLVFDGSSVTIDGI